MKKIENFLGYLAVILIIISTSIYSYPYVADFLRGDLGAGFNESPEVTLIGSSDNLVSLPNASVFANSTTTDAGGLYPDGGFVLNQYLGTPGIRLAYLNISAIGGTPTSTLHVRQMGSFDGTNYFDIATTTAQITPTSTGITIQPRGVDIVPGLATTSDFVIPFSIDGFPHSRFVIYGDDVADDPDDGVQAHIRAVMIEDIVR